MTFFFPFFLILFLFSTSLFAFKDISDKDSAKAFIEPFKADFFVKRGDSVISVEDLLNKQKELLKKAKESPKENLRALGDFQKDCLEQSFNMGLFWICSELASRAENDLFYFWNEEIQNISDDTFFINSLFEVQSDIENESFHTASDNSADHQMIARLIERKAVGNDLNAIRAWALHLKYSVGRFVMSNEDLIQGRALIDDLLGKPESNPRSELRKYLKRFHLREKARIYLYQYKWKEAADILRPVARSGDLLAKAWLAKCSMYLNEYQVAGDLINSLIRGKEARFLDFQAYTEGLLALAQWQAGAMDHEKALSSLENVHFETILRSKIEQAVLNFDSPRLIQFPLYHMYRMKASSLKVLGRIDEAQNAAIFLSSIARSWSRTAIMATTESEKLRFRELIEDVPFTVAAITNDNWLLADDLVFFKGLVAESLAEFPFTELPTIDYEKGGFDKDLAREKTRLDLFSKQFDKRRSKSADWVLLTDRIPEDSVFVDFVKCGGRLNERGWTEQVYYAVISFKNAKRPIVYDLGKATEIEAAISRFLALVDLNYPDEELGIVSTSLFNKLLKPVIGWLPNGFKIIFCPDAQLSFLNLAALADEEGVFVAERWRTLTVTSARDLFSNQDLQFNKKETSVVLADPDFGTPAIGGAGGRRSFSLQPLPESSREAQYVMSALQKRGLSAKILAGSEATEKNFRSLTNPPVIHLATHGFFLGDHGIKNPMRASGLALAGSAKSADRAKRGLCGNDPDDGILTAEEISQMNLQSTWLVSVSACESGMGRSLDGEGILGLRRGFQNAGVKNLLLCLWPIQDEDARTFMESFYDGIGKGLSPQDAYSDTVASLLSTARQEGGLSQAIRRAGAFVLSGAPARNHSKRQISDSKSFVEAEKK